MPIILGDSVGGMSISSAGGKTVIVTAGGKVIVDGKVVSEGEPLPEVDQTYENVSHLEISSAVTRLTPGDKLHVNGTGSASQTGRTLKVELIDGTIEVPDIDSLTIRVNSGIVSGSINQVQSVDVKANSGKVILELKSTSTPVEINATANSSDIRITVN